MSSSEKFHNTSPQSIAEILSSVKGITVPRFQRNYSWNTSKAPSQVSQLWNDLTEKFSEYNIGGEQKDGEYLLGPMVFVKNSNDSKILDIVDGQQRLATITMIFCVARDIIIELNEEKIMSTPGWMPRGLDNIIEFIENRIEDVKNNSDKHQSWKLKLNSVDNRFYRENIQEYESPLREEFCNPGGKYKIISKKVDRLKDELKGVSRQNYADSQILLIEAYLKIHQNMQESLITEFKMGDDAELSLQELEEKSKKETESNLRSNPIHYELSEHFFDDGLYGLDTLEHQSWNPENKKIIDEEYDKWSKSKKGIGNPMSFETWVNDQLARKKRAKYGISKKSFDSIKDNELSKITDVNSKTNKIDHITKLISFCKTGIGNCMFSIRVIVNDDEDAFQIFETFNERGVPLSKSNLIKNWVLKQIKDEQSQITYSGYWDDLFRSLSTEGDNFLRESLRSRGYNELGSQKTIFDSYPIHNYPTKVKVTNNNLYKIVKFQINDEKKSIQYVKDLEEDAEISARLTEPVKNYPKSTIHQIDQFRDEYPAILDMLNLNAINIRLPIITAYRKWGIGNDSYKMLVKFLVPFFFRYKTVSDKNATKLEKSMIKVCEKIENGVDPESDLESIVKVLVQDDNDNDFSNDFIGRFEPPSEDTAKYVLQHLTTFLGSKYDDVNPIDGLTLEHVLPQKPLVTGSKPSGNWIMSDFFNNYDYDLHQIPKTFEHWHKKLGNLTLLKFQINTKIKNKNFITKRDSVDDSVPPVSDGYKSSSLPINVQTVLTDPNTDVVRNDWTANSILERGQFIAEKAKQIWALPEIICSDEKCLGYKKPTKPYGGFEKIDDVTCGEELNGVICGKKLIIKWPVNNAPEYRVPKEYLLKNN